MVSHLTCLICMYRINIQATLFVILNLLSNFAT